MKQACVLCLVLLALSSTSGETLSITEIVDETGDGGANQLNFPEGIALDEMGNVYLSGAGSNNAFRIASVMPSLRSSTRPVMGSQTS